MRKYEDCNWCQSVIEMKKEREAREGKCICQLCHLDLTYRCSACWEMHDEEHLENGDYNES
jgi:hypothetical protein